MRTTGAIYVVVLLFALEISAASQSLDVMRYSADDVRILECDSYQNLLPFCRCCHPCPDNGTTYCEGGCPSQNNPSESRCRHPAIQSTTENSRPRFVYKLTLSNQGSKTIRVVEWDYIFVDRETKAEVAKHQFRSEEKVRPGKRKTLVEYSTFPPTKVISVKALSQPEADRFIEKVAIRRVTFRDGSIWENLSISP